MRRLNIGCGRTPTKGWRNYDNSLSVRLANVGFWGKPIIRILPLSSMQREFIAHVHTNQIAWANTVQRIPEEDQSVDVVYSSHMFEHLTQLEAILLLKEIQRVLRPGGRVRFAVPDLSRLVNEYLEHRDADKFIGDTYMALQPPRSLWGRLRRLIVGDRHHLWMYDAASLCRLLIASGFEQAEAFNAGDTGILDPGELDLFERESESVYVEAVKGT